MITAERTPEEKLAMVSKLAEQLAERALADMMQQRPVDDQTATALAEAVLLLRDYGQPAPPLALDLLTRFFRQRHARGEVPEQAAPAEEASAPDSNQESQEASMAGKLTGLFRALRR